MPAKGAQLFEELMRFRPEGLTANGWAVKAGVSRNFWNDLKRHGNPSRRTLEKLLAAADSSLAEFEALRIGEDVAGSATAAGRLRDTRRAWPSAQCLPLPLLGSRFGGEWQSPGSGIALTEIRRDERRGSLARPASLAADPDAYAVTIVDDAMWPRFRPGRRVAVSPAAPVAVGDDVLVVLRSGSAGGELVLIKELARRTGRMIELRQFNPDLSFQVDGADIEAIHKVAGELF